MTRIMILSGAGLSAESGIPTFRDKTTGLWANFDPDLLANYNTWKDNFENVHQFYNDLRLDLKNRVPNKAHYKIAEWQQKYNVDVVTQNIDLLCEKAGCQNVIHVHGQIDEMQCKNCGYNWKILNKYDTSTGCPNCSSVRNVKPAVVFFHERAPLYEKMFDLIGSLTEDDIFICIGTSGAVIQVNSIAKNIPAKTIINVLDLERDSDGYFPPLVTTDWDHFLLGPATVRVDDIEKIIQDKYGS